MGKKGSDTPLGWDDPLPDELMRQWQSWRDALVNLETVSVPMCYHPKDFGRVVCSEIQMSVKMGLESSPTFETLMSQETLTLHSCLV